MSSRDTTDDERMAEVDTDTADIKHTRSVSMDDSIRAEFGLSVHEYNCLLRALQSRLGVHHIEDLAFVSVEQLAAVTDHWDAAAVKRLFDIVTTHIGVEKLYRAGAMQAVACDPSTGPVDIGGNTEKEETEKEDGEAN